jgi:ABC-type nitrate/sulfonate/bicarbonate transport system substrate-binding protein
LREEQNTVEYVLKALLLAQAFINNPQNKSTVIKAMSTYLRENDPAALEDGFHVLKANMARKPYPSIAGLNNIKRLLTISNLKVAEVKPEDLIDDACFASWTAAGFWTAPSPALFRRCFQGDK